MSRVADTGLCDKGPPRGRSAEDSPLGESRLSMPNSSGGGIQSGQSGPKSQNPPYHPPRVEKVSEKRSASSASSAHTDCPADPMRFYGSGNIRPEVPE
jgi:hypothetical protein